MARKKTLRLILGDQLDENHEWFSRDGNDAVYVLMEVRSETDYVVHHVQKVAAFFASMRKFAETLSNRGFRVIYIPLDNPANRQSFAENIARLVEEEDIGRFEYLEPDEYRVDRELSRLAKQLPVDSACLSSGHFLTARDDVGQFFAGKKRFLMESFYRHMRKKHGILMEDGKPAGGKWNYDVKNRNPYDGKAPIPEPLVFDNDVSDIVRMIEKSGVQTFGEIEPEKLPWPVSREQSLALLRYFLENGLPHFGVYQDAMSEESWSLFHSRLSFSLNTKMLHPMEVVRAAVEASQQDRKGSKIGIEQVEGFVRQILGWREYVRGIYWARMPEYKDMDFFNHKRKLPDFYWTGRTRMNCMAKAIGQSLKRAYAHHIQRLMVTGNFALLAGIDPDQVDAWYLGVYIDAVEWVELINTRGMSQFADGGIVATKPYIGSANYIDSMSDYCRSCFYRSKKRTGDRACPFNSFYWDFLARHRELLQNNPRIGMMYRTWDRMKPEKRDGLLEQARKYLGNLDDL